MLAIADLLVCFIEEYASPGAAAWRHPESAPSTRLFTNSAESLGTRARHSTHWLASPRTGVQHQRSARSVVDAERLHLAPVDD